MIDRGIAILWSLRGPALPYRGTRLSDRCPVVQCGRVCRYDIPDQSKPGYKYSRVVDGRCLTKAEARRRIDSLKRALSSAESASGRS